MDVLSPSVQALQSYQEHFRNVQRDWSSVLLPTERGKPISVKTDQLPWRPCLLLGGIHLRSYPKSCWNVPVEFRTKGWPPGNTLAAELTNSEGCHAYRFSKTPSFYGKIGDAVPLGWVVLTVRVLYSLSVPAPLLFHSKNLLHALQAGLWLACVVWKSTLIIQLILCWSIHLWKSCSTKH